MITELKIKCERSSGSKVTFTTRIIGSLKSATHVVILGNGDEVTKITSNTKKGQRVMISNNNVLVQAYNNDRLTEYKLLSIESKEVNPSGSLWGEV